MTVFGLLLQIMTNDPLLLGSFGFYQESYFISFILFLSLYIHTIDVPLRFGFRWHTNYLEKDADRYAVRRGLGKMLQSALIRSHAKSLDPLFTSWLYEAWNSNHPNL